MEVREDWDIHVTVDEMVRRLSPGRSPNETMIKVYEEAIDLGARLVQPKSIHGDFAIERIENGRVLLENGLSFSSAHLGRLLAGADRVVVMCRTIGPSLEKAVASLQEQGDVLSAFVLDNYEINRGEPVGTQAADPARGRGAGPG